MPSFNLPNPIIFGTDFPKLRLRVEYGNQYLYSLSNYNLYIQESDLTDDGTYPAGSLWKSSLGLSTRFWGGAAPDFSSSKGLNLPQCITERQPCPMLMEGWEQREFKGDDSAKPKFTLTRVKLHEKPQLYQCQLLSALLNCSATPAEKRFAEMYYTWAIAGADADPGSKKLEWQFGNLNRKYGDFVRRWQEQQLQLEEFYRGPENASEAIVTSLKAPALIPQVWLNYTYEPTRSLDEAQEELEHMPMRVDFLFIRKRELHVVEIDDPSHYAKYDKHKRKYEVDEELYTINLRAERTLRREGFHIHRLGNWEILNATESDLILLIPHALGMGLAVSEASPHIPGMKQS